MCTAPVSFYERDGGDENVRRIPSHSGELLSVAKPVFLGCIEAVLKGQRFPPAWQRRGVIRRPAWQCRFALRARRLASGVPLLFAESRMRRTAGAFVDFIWRRRH